MVQEVLGVACRSLHFHDVLQPFTGAFVRAGAVGWRTRLVQPVRGNAHLGNVVHVFCPDLHFQGHAVRAEQDGVQGLVSV